MNIRIYIKSILKKHRNKQIMSTIKFSKKMKIKLKIKIKFWLNVYKIFVKNINLN